MPSEVSEDGSFDLDLTALGAQLASGPDAQLVLRAEDGRVERFRLEALPGKRYLNGQGRRFFSGRAEDGSEVHGVVSRTSFHALVFRVDGTETSYEQVVAGKIKASASGHGARPRTPIEVQMAESFDRAKGEASRKLALAADGTAYQREFDMVFLLTDSLWRALEGKDPNLDVPEVFDDVGYANGTSYARTADFVAALFSDLDARLLREIGVRTSANSFAYVAPKWGFVTNVAWPPPPDLQYWNFQDPVLESRSLMYMGIGTELMQYFLDHVFDPGDVAGINVGKSALVGGVVPLYPPSVTDPMRGVTNLDGTVCSPAKGDLYVPVLVASPATASTPANYDAYHLARYFLHEFGHNFGATHTYSTCPTGDTIGVEPASGSTVMAYAGSSLCSEAEQVQPDGYSYFHGQNILQMDAFFATVESTTPDAQHCVQLVKTPNHPPSIAFVPESAPNQYRVPAGTQLLLTAFMSDADPANDGAASTQRIRGAIEQIDRYGDGGYDPIWRSLPGGTPPFGLLKRSFGNDFSPDPYDPPYIPAPPGGVEMPLHFIATAHDDGANFEPAGGAITAASAYDTDQLAVKVTPAAAPTFTPLMPDTGGQLIPNIQYSLGWTDSPTWHAAVTFPELALERRSGTGWAPLSTIVQAPKATNSISFLSPASPIGDNTAFELRLRYTVSPSVGWATAPLNLIHVSRAALQRHNGGEAFGANAAWTTMPNPQTCVGCYYNTAFMVGTPDSAAHTGAADVAIGKGFPGVYGPDATASFASPVFSLANKTAAEWIFWYVNTLPAGDVVNAQYSADGGASWHTIDAQPGNAAAHLPNSPGWRQFGVPNLRQLCGSSQCRLRLQFASNGDTQWIGHFRVDDILLQAK